MLGGRIMVLTAATAADVQGVLAVIGEVWTFLASKVADVVTIVMENPLLIIPIGVILSYTIIALFRRLF